MAATLLTVMVTVSVSVPPFSSSTVRVNVTVAPDAPTGGAMNVGAGPVRVIVGVLSLSHEYDRESPSGSDESLPSRVTVVPSFTVWTSPASAVGGWLDASVTVTFSTRWLPVPKGPMDVMFASYTPEEWLTSVFNSKVLPVKLTTNRPESVPSPMPYVGECPSRTPFWAEMAPTALPSSPRSISVLSSVTYQFPRFCRKEGVSENISLMLVTFETFQSLRGWLKDLAPSNMLPMLVTLETFQSLRGRSKDLAPKNIPLMSVTLDTSQEERGQLKDLASANM